ncbi:MAG: glycosyltransferase family 4 protein [Rhodospirillaceae bacterium TMED63]|nr:MAG: glycosyltransferase family 4 protein [Rhodospirillaceae bacterium TMED63]
MSITVPAFHILFAIALFALSVVTTYVVLRLGILDEPNHRSSHDQPTPSTGGIAIFVAFVGGFATVWFVSDEARLSTFHLAGFAVAATGIASVGFLDDLNKLKTFKIKLAAQVAAAMMLLVFGIVFSRVSLPVIGAFDLGWLGYPLTVIWVVAMTNIFNFMDGLNGLAGGVAVTVAAFLCAVTYIEGSFFVYILCYVMAASAAGFLLFNFPKARLFMGDVGSQFIGFAFAALAVIAAEIDASRTSFLVVPLLFFNFIFDTIFTLLRRALGGEDITQAHRTHLYQLLNRIGWSHVQVSLLHFLMTALQGIGALMLVGYGPDERMIVFLPFLAGQIVYATLVIQGARRRGILPTSVCS